MGWDRVDIGRTTSVAFSKVGGIAMRLHVHIEKDEAGYYVAEVPALPGCLSQGKTKEEAVRNIQEAIEGWLEVMESKKKYSKKELVEVVV
jgi:predicted RNase H-like HicB family nuclease